VLFFIGELYNILAQFDIYLLIDLSIVGKNSSRRVESSLKSTGFLGHPGLMAGVFRELENTTDRGETS